MLFIILIIGILIIIIFRISLNKKTSNKNNINLESGENNIYDFIPEEKELRKTFKLFLDNKNPAPEFIERIRKPYLNTSLAELNKKYFLLLGLILEEKRMKNINKMLGYCQGSLALIEPLIIFEKIKYGSFDIKSIPAIEEALPHYAVLGLRGQMKNIKEIVDYLRDIHFLKKHVERAFEMKKLASLIYKHVSQNPGVIQKNLKKELQYTDGRIIANVIYYMTLHNKIIREKQGNSYKLTVSNHNYKTEKQ